MPVAFCPTRLLLVGQESVSSSGEIGAARKGRKLAQTRGNLLDPTFLRYLSITERADTRLVASYAIGDATVEHDNSMAAPCHTQAKTRSGRSLTPCATR
jgi:hypothetical protein